MQKKLPLINSAHGSDTRNIINELIKLFNGMGYTYNESLQKAQDILDEAQQTNDMNESVQQQINTLIAESGTSDAEVLQARIDAEGNEYQVLKGRLDEKEQNFSTQLAQTQKHTAGALNAKSYNAVGDGISDDTAYLQKMAIDAYRNKKSFKIPSGEYLISKPLLVIVGNNELESSIKIEGENLENTVIKCGSNFKPHLSEGVLSNTASIIVVNETFLNSDNTFKNGSGRTGSVFIDNFYLLCENNNVDYGILFGCMNVGSTYERIRTRGFSKAGFKNLDHFYLNVLNKCRVDNSPISYDFGKFINTSTTLNSCYSVGATDIAFKVRGAYMNMINPAVDGCTGVVYDLTGFRGTVTSPGAESPRADVLFKGGSGTNVTIIGSETNGNFDDANAWHIDTGNASKMTFVGGRLLQDNTEGGRKAPGGLYKLGIHSELTLNDVIYNSYSKNNDYKDDNNKLTMKTSDGEVHTRLGGDLAYLGHDGGTNSPFIDSKSDNPFMSANSLFFGLGDSPNKTLVGRNLTWTQRSNLGDVLLSKRPKKIGGLGWVNVFGGESDVVFKGSISSINTNVLTMTLEPELSNFDELLVTPKRNWGIKSSSGGTGVLNSISKVNKTITVDSMEGTWMAGDSVILTPLKYWARGPYAKIPLLLSGSTEERPTTNLVNGQSYFDETLNIPIYWGGSSWKKYSDNTTV